MQTGAQKTAFLWPIVAIISLLTFVSMTLETQAQNLGGRTLEKAPQGTPAPKTRWLDADGNTVRLADFRGKVVLLNLWATWCGPCVIEMPDLDALQKKYGRSGLEVVAVSLNEEGPAAIKPFFAEHGLDNLKIYYGGEAPAKDFGARTLPSSYLINRDGTLIGEVPGFAKWQTIALEKHIQHALKKGFKENKMPFEGREVRELGK